MTKIQKIQVTGVKVPYRAQGRDYEADAVHRAASLIAKKTGCTPENLHIAKKSIDARKGEISFVYTVYAEVAANPAKLNDPSFRIYSEPVPEIRPGCEKMNHRPVIVGFGPAGMFAGLLLAENGYRPVIFERGACVDDRIKAVDRFIREGILDTSTNIQFGAGGAGTFSDGKLTTRINDPLASYVVKKLHEFGAPEDVLYKAKPHIGTDVLREVVKNIDREITRLGGEIRYNSKAERITDGCLYSDGMKTEFDALILAVGHSARDTYSEIISSGMQVEAKAFSVGVRAEHLQSDIDAALFGEHAGDPTLGRGEYALSFRKGDRGVYTFCMCPGGTVVPSASEEGGVVTNGMSTHARDGRNANAAVCVSVLPADFGNDPVKAVGFQRELERAAFRAGGGDYSAPYETVGDFLGTFSGTHYSRIVPTYRDGGVREYDLKKILPDFVSGMLAEGINDFGRKIKGFDSPDAVLTGVETRTSSPLRILRGDDLLAIGRKTIYPCGEGAGYAGGIVSAAVDGLRVASAVISRFSPVD